MSVYAVNEILMANIKLMKCTVSNIGTKWADRDVLF